MVQEISAEKLYRTFDPEELGIITTEECDHVSGIIGQERAVSALQFGLEIGDEGFNIFVVGPPGIGKMSTVENFLEKIAEKKETPWDWCYVNNFEDSYKPKAVSLPPGKGREFKKDMEELIDNIRRDLPVAFESEEYTAKREEITNSLNMKREAVSDELKEKAEKAGFTLQASPMGIMIFPTKEGKKLNEDEFRKLPESEREEYNERRKELQKELNEATKKIRKQEREARDKLQELDKQVALNLTGGIIEDFKEKYSDLEDVTAYLDEVKEDIVENISAFKKEQQQKQQGGGGGGQTLQLGGKMQNSTNEMFKKYKVNVLIDNSKQEGAPVVTELNPSYPHLFGRIEKEMKMGAFITDHTLIKPGAFHQANGGYLVLQAEDVLRNFMSWESIKRAIRSGEIEMEELSERLGFMSTKSLRPQPIPLNIKILLIARPLVYLIMQAYDQDVPELFKVKAHYDVVMDCNEQKICEFMTAVSAFCRKEELKHLDSGGAAKLLEHAVRLAGDQKKISTHFGAVADVIREASFWASKDNADNIEASHIKKAIDQKRYRSNLIQEKIEEMIKRDVLHIQVEGSEKGQVNGLSVINVGDYQFGRPSRITAGIAPGREGIIDIEREAKLGGPIHSKGVLILSGYLSQKYAHEIPLSLAARLVFEQSYQGVEGDSASSAELYALLSVLSDLPLKQGIAVTGSVDQYGNIQAVGGINEKIEGFFYVCRDKGFTGDQGVLIPESNRDNLTLREEVIEAVKEGKFHVWPVGHVDEGIELLTGKKAGEKDEKGAYPEDTVNYLVDRKLRRFADKLKEFASAGKKNENE